MPYRRDKRMKVQIVSDLHLEFYEDFRPIIEAMDPTDVDVLVVAGDLSTEPELFEVLTLLSEKYPQVLYVLGNHEYYRNTLKGIHKRMVLTCTHLKNVQWLHNTVFTIEGQRFVGTPLWFQDEPLNVIYEKFLNDFSQIKDFRSWVYKENKKAKRYLNSRIEEGDIVITHHLPTMRSVPSRFMSEPLNRFFVCDLEGMIRALKPKLWIHGHTHDSFDYMIEDTRIVCNPMGYMHQKNPYYIPGLVIEV
ncbi:MAG: hypothetical protein GF334_00720 [Candidatus Altiarchaeales archaeon]|nr:hypothetical protein [Candidatus Altiarchaeales archaeon]